jgi:hypothetical protein
MGTRAFARILLKGQAEDACPPMSTVNWNFYVARPHHCIVASSELVYENIARVVLCAGYGRNFK